MMVLAASAASKIGVRWSQVLQRSFSVLEVTDLVTLKRIMVKHRPALLLLDLALPRLGGLAGVSAVQHLHPSTKIITFARNPDDQEAIGALGAGAKGGGAGAAFVREQMDRSFRDADDLEAATGLRVVANVPKIKAKSAAR